MLHIFALGDSVSTAQQKLMNQFACQYLLCKKLLNDPKLVQTLITRELTFDELTLTNAEFNDSFFSNPPPLQTKQMPQNEPN